MFWERVESKMRAFNCMSNMSGNVVDPCPNSMVKCSNGKESKEWSRGGGTNASSSSVSMYEDICPIDSTESESSTMSRVSIKDFSILKVLGKGAFGKVLLVRKNDDNEVYAMKTLRKSTLIRRKQLAHTATERYVLENVKSQFISSLRYAFQSSEKLYMVMDYM
jgi:serum/glucocorticoid-regulated kinase 2